jgi:phospholipid/cholesterol/gamma-HCH transport system substrate-binding protein
MAGIKIGRVERIEFRGIERRAPGQRPPAPIRVGAEIQKRYLPAIHDNSRWFVTSQGVLGEMFLAVEPGSADRPPLADGAVVVGISPPRLDLLLGESFELLHRAYRGITENEREVSEMFTGLHRTLKGTGDFFDHNSGNLDTMVSNATALTEDARSALGAARERYVDGPQISRIFNNAERVTHSLDEHLDPLLADTRAVAADAKKLTGTLASDAQLERYRRISQNLNEASAKATRAAADAEAVLAHVKRGQGTVGALVMDEALYDDIQELLRDLKHNPWKFFWRE